MFLLITMIFVSGCVSNSTETVRNQEDVSKIVTNVSQNVGEIGSTLDQIDQKLS